MATNKMIIQDDKGNSYYPQTSSDVVFDDDGKTVKTKLADSIKHETTSNIHRKITFGTADPTGGADGDIYLQYE